MAKVWSGYLDTDPFTFSLDHHGDGDFILRVFQDPQIPQIFSVLCGEWLYNLRSCLDYIIWATAAHEKGLVPPPDENKLQYPIYTSEKEWSRSLYRLNNLGPHHRDMLLQMQPFNSNADANYLGWLNELARIDRHRQLNSATAYVAEARPVIEIPERSLGKTTLQWGQRVLIDGVADLARISIRPWNGDIDPQRIRVNPRAGVDPEILAWARSPFWRGVRLTERMRMIHLFVAAEIAVYEYDCTGSSRTESLLTEEYKAQCDGRGAKEDILRSPRPAVDWSKPEPGHQATSLD